MSIYPTLRYTHSKAAVRFLVEAFGFTEKSMSEAGDGTVAHAELVGPAGGLVMVGQRRSGTDPFDTARCVTYVVVDDPDAHHDRAVRAGATIVHGPRNQDYGSREYAAEDPDGNVWSFGTYRP